MRHTSYFRSLVERFEWVFGLCNYFRWPVNGRNDVLSFLDKFATNSQTQKGGRIGCPRRETRSKNESWNRVVTTAGAFSDYATTCILKNKINIFCGKIKICSTFRSAFVIAVFHKVVGGFTKLYIAPAKQKQKTACNDTKFYRPIFLLYSTISKLVRNYMC